MSKSKELAIRLKEVFLDGTWIANTNYKKQLENVTWQESEAQIASLNTIATLTFHINYYVAGVLNVFENGKLEIRDKYSFHTSEIKSKKDWEILKNKLFTNAEKLVNYVEKLSLEKLEGVFFDEKFGSYYRNIEGIIDHSYYHLGQISLIKKMVKI